MNISKFRTFFALIALVACGAAAAQDRPNILVIFGDDVGPYNISAYNMGRMGYRTPNIDSIANDGIIFTDSYGDQSCTAGRAGFITGQHPRRTGMTKVGLPGAKEGMQKEDPTIAGLLKPLGYVTGQFGKNHLGDRDEFLPTNHGFDEFFGNLYHLNAEEEPENVDYPKDPGFRERFGPRGVIHAYADGEIQDTGPLTKKRMETVDEEFLAAALDFIDRAHADGKPFFTWFNSSRMHVYTHLKPESQGVTGYGVYADGMVEHDGHVGQLLQKLKDLGIEDNTIVVYTTDNGAELFFWPDGGYTPYRSEKNSNWEGAYRVPMMVKWPAEIEGGQIVNDIIAQMDWLPTFLAAAGEPDIKEKLLRGHRAGDMRYKVHLDGYNMLPFFKGEVDEGPRKEFIYTNDSGQIIGIRDGDWKIVYKEQRSHGYHVWIDPWTTLRAPKLFNLRMDPFERMDYESAQYAKWWTERMFLFAPSAVKVQQFLDTFEEYPQRQKPASWVIE